MFNESTETNEKIAYIVALVDFPTTKVSGPCLVDYTRKIEAHFLKNSKDFPWLRKNSIFKYFLEV